MIIESLSPHNLHAGIHLMLGLWPHNSFEETHTDCQAILTNRNEACYLVKNEEVYIAFVHITLRYDYVEGAENTPVAYIEGMSAGKMRQSVS
ncbi:hypothetical protein HNQ91_005148 [Filimonas zeae]|uniref:Uncharacterized protein n=1 Tax=Filimonas zeae TaxID=1737353 RepID=A0A917J2A8_9BACT|nr:hypothetical protein [Filimonas zeae]MDR6342071.1 hypothetical protein [Filimonas zeae]GGH79222.1 hypothetical protein GCM10011379_48260 [Filimonas zeae]